MSQFADAVARLTIDKDFARATRREPDRVAVLYGLSRDEAAKLRELAWPRPRSPTEPPPSALCSPCHRPPSPRPWWRRWVYRSPRRPC